MRADVPTWRPAVRRAIPHIQGTDTLGRVKLVAGQRQQVDTQIIGVKRHFASRLRRIGVQQNAPLARVLCNVRDRLHGADFVVGVHDRYQNRVVFQHFDHIVRCNP